MPSWIDIPWDEAEAWGEMSMSPWPAIDADTDAPFKYVHRLDSLPDGTEFVDRKGAQKVKVGSGSTQGSVVVCDGAVMVFSQFDGAFLVRYADAAEEPREEFLVKVKVEARDAEEAHEFVSGMLGDIRWDDPLEVTYVSDAVRARELPHGGER